MNTKSLMLILTSICFVLIGHSVAFADPIEDVPGRKPCGIGGAESSGFSE